MSDHQYIPGGGWQLAGLADDGTVWAEPVIAWEFINGVGSPVLADAGTPLIGDPGADSNSGYWLVAPGEDPATSRYRPGTETQ